MLYGAKLPVVGGCGVVRLTRLTAIAMLTSMFVVTPTSSVQAAEVGCDADPSSGDIQAVIDANPPGATIQLALGCRYSVTTPILLKENDTLIGGTSSVAPETFLFGSGQVVDCIGPTDPTGLADAIGVRIQTLDISGCRTGIRLNDEWEVGGAGTLGVWSHDNNIGLSLGTVPNPSLDITVTHVKLFGNDQLGLRGAMSDTGTDPRATIAFSEIFANGDGGAECTQVTNCAGSKLLGGYAAPGGASPLVCGNVVSGNAGPRTQGHGLWVDVTGDNIGTFGQGLLFAGNTVENNAGQGFRIERSDSHRIGDSGKVSCAGTTIDATNVINNNGTRAGSCVAVVVSEYTQVTDNECNVQDHTSAAGGQVIQITWRTRADLDEDADGDVECTSSDPDDCQKTTHNVVMNNTVRLRPSVDPEVTSVGFFVSEVPFPGMWTANDYTSNDYCVDGDPAREKAADHFSWVDSSGSALDLQPWSLSGTGNDWRDPPDPRFDENPGASFSARCKDKV
jgi:hypothetical protein